MTVQTLKTKIIDTFLAVAGMTMLARPTTAADDVAAALAGFTEAADKLEAASQKAGDEMDESYDRQDAAQAELDALVEREYEIREIARVAMRKAERAADQIRALVGA